MTVKNQLKPYYNKFRIAYLIKIGLLSLGTTLGMIAMVLLISKFIILSALIKIIQYIIFGNVIGAVVLAYYFAPKKSWMHKEIDALGFENRISTYYDYKEKENPFKEYLEKDLLMQLDKEALYKTIKLTPPKEIAIVTLTLMLLLGGLSLWQTEISQKSEDISQAIEIVEEEEKKLIENLETESLETETMELLESITEESLEALKEALREDNNLLAEQELFKMEEAMKNALGEKELPEGMGEQLNALGDLIESKNTQSLLTALGESSLQEGLLSENAENAETIIDANATTGELKEGDASTQEASEASQNEGDGT